MTEDVTDLRIASTVPRSGESEHTGSVAAASRARSIAWQRQPPKSCELRSQDLQGSCIQDSPRNLWNASLWSQMSRRGFSLTFSNRRPGMTLAAWQGSASPFGAISITLRPQPPMHGFGYFA